MGSFSERSLAIAPMLCFAVVVTLSVTASATTPRNPSDPGWCRACHREAAFLPQPVSPWAHEEVACRECHQNYQFDPHEEVEVAEGELIEAMKERGVGNPVAMAACFDCHDAADEDQPARWPHGDNDGLGKGLPHCLDCHGSVHLIRLESSLPDLQRRQIMNRRCASCHANAARMAVGATGVDSSGERQHPPEFADGKGLKSGGHGGHGHHDGPAATGLMGGYQDTVHGRKLSLGSSRAPGCVDCHGGHEVSVPGPDGPDPCKACHENSGPGFRALAIHQPLSFERRPVGAWTLKFFAWLTFLTILALSIHVLLDVVATLRRGLRRKPEDEEPVPEGSVQRFDVHQRISHGLMIVSFVLLVLTGWPLTTHGIGASRTLMDWFGGVDGCGLVHRIAGIGLVVCALHHMAWLAVMWFKGRLRFSMLPALKDFKDVIGNVMYFFGLKAERPHFGRYSYFEKFDYWAVFWGCVIMIGSGLMRWFPETLAEYAPAWAYDIAYVAHTDEALLAALAIFVWHFYNVHLRPAVFPMSWVFLTGRISLHELREDHRQEYDALDPADVADATDAEADDGGAS